MPITTHDYFAEQTEFTSDTVVDIDVPSGQLIAADHLRLVEHFNVEPPLSTTSGAGLNAWARAYAQKSNTAYAFVGNTSPTIVREGNTTLSVISPAWEESSRTYRHNEVPVARIWTDVWSTMLTDYQNWREHGGADISTINNKFLVEVYTVIDVTPGKYQWTVFSHKDGFDCHAPDRVTFARLECIETY